MVNLGAARRAIPALDDGPSDWTLALGLAALAVVAVAYAAAMRLALRTSPWTA